MAGWLYDHRSDPYWPSLFAVALFAMTARANLSFRAIQKRRVTSSG
jgi:hypothetical protein